MTARGRASWPVVALALACAGAVAAAILVVGPASGNQSPVTRTATVARGVVQATVSGSGNLESTSQLDLGFKTSGTVTGVYVKQGQHVVQGQLLAALDPQSAEVTLEQAKAALQSAEADVVKEEAAASEATSADTEAATQKPDTTATGAATGAQPGKTGTRPDTSRTSTGAPSGDSAGTPTSTSKDTSTSTQSATVSAATRAADLASARAAVRSDRLTVQSDEQAVQDTKLYAPESGTIVSLSGQVGEVVSASGTSRASSAPSSSSSSTGAGTATAAGARSSAAGTGSSADSGTSGAAGNSSFAVLSDLESMQLVVALSEAEIGNVKPGQIATVTVEALEGRKLAAHVSEVGLVSTSTSGAVSYDVTFALDQLEGGLKLGMSATAEVVVKQAEGLNVPTSAISGDTVTVSRNGKQVRQRVVTGLAGNSSTIVLSGLKAGETVVLPSASSGAASATNLLSRLGSRLGGGTGALGGGALGGGLGRGGGGGAFFRGGG